MGGLEPPRRKATDFKSVMSTIPSHGPGEPTLLILLGVSSIKNISYKNYKRFSSFSFLRQKNLDIVNLVLT